MKCYEAFESREGKGGEITLGFIVDEVQDDEQALGHLFSVAPATFRGLYRQNADIKWKPLGHQTWKFDVPYTPTEPNTSEDEGGGDTTDPFGIIDFDTTGGTQHITTAIDQKMFPKNAGQGAAFTKAIGVTRDGVEGVDVVVPQFKFTVTKTYRRDAITPQQILDIKHLTGKTNSAPYQVRGLTFLIGELLFLGATGSSSGRKDWQIVYHFLASEEALNLDIGGINIPKKLGHEYLWCMFAKEEEVNRLVEVPDIAFLATVFESDDFGHVLGIL